MVGVTVKGQKEALRLAAQEVKKGIEGLSSEEQKRLYLEELATQHFCERLDARA